jgi:hypothetical protein
MLEIYMKNLEDFAKILGKRTVPPGFLGQDRG